MIIVHRQFQFFSSFCYTTLQVKFYWCKSYSLRSGLSVSSCVMHWSVYHLFFDVCMVLGVT